MRGLWHFCYGISLNVLLLLQFEHIIAARVKGLRQSMGKRLLHGSPLPTSLVFLLAHCQVYIGSFNSDAPINAEKNPHCKELFLAEQEQLLADLYEIPHRSCDRKVSSSSSSSMLLA